MRTGDLAEVAYLMGRGANPNARPKGKRFTSLQYAERNSNLPNHAAILELLRRQ